MFFTFVFSPRKVFEICSFINSQCLSIAETIISLSLVLSSDSAISTHFCPFCSIHIFAMERMCRAFLKHMYMATIVVYVCRNGYQQKHFQESQLSHKVSSSLYHFSFIGTKIKEIYETTAEYLRFLVDLLYFSFINEVVRPINAQNGDLLPVSSFKGYEDGTWPQGTAAYEKRGVGAFVPVWTAENCIQCNKCAFVCPHACIRPFVLDEAEAAGLNAPMIDMKAPAAMKGMKFRIQVGVMDCLSCGNCVDVCPGNPKAGSSVVTVLLTTSVTVVSTTLSLLAKMLTSSYSIQKFTLTQVVSLLRLLRSVLSLSLLLLVSVYARKTSV